MPRLEIGINGQIAHLFLTNVSETRIKPAIYMEKFNVRLASYLDESFLQRVAYETNKPQSRRAVARKLNLSVYAVKRLFEYYQSNNIICKGTTM